VRNLDASAIILLAIRLTNLRSQGLTRNDLSALLSPFERAAHFSTSKVQAIHGPRTGQPLV
jgi:hypothetical protein